MNRKLISGLVLSLFIIWSISISFSTTKICSYDYGFGIRDYPQNTHDCEKINSNFCYFPISDYKNLAPTSDHEPFSDPNFLSGITFSSKYGGCGIPDYTYVDKKLKIRAKDVRVDEIRNFLNSCGSYNFDIQTDLTYKL